MNFLNQKKLGSIIVLVIISISYHYCMPVNPSKKVIEISNAIPIKGEGYEYSLESILKANGNVYSLRSKSYYDSNGNLIKLTIYKPEGVLEYQHSEIMSDTSILLNLGLPQTQTWIYFNDSLRNNHGEVKAVERISDDLLKSTVDGKVIIYHVK